MEGSEHGARYRRVESQGAVEVEEEDKGEEETEEFAKGKVCSSKMTCRDKYHLLLAKSRHL